MKANEIIASICVGAASLVAVLGHEGWGWFLFAAFILATD